MIPRGRINPIFPVFDLYFYLKASSHIDTLQFTPLTTWCRHTDNFNFMHGVQVIESIKKRFTWEHRSIISDLDTILDGSSLFGNWQHVEEILRHVAHLWLLGPQTDSDRSLQPDYFCKKSSCCGISSSWSAQKSPRSERKLPRCQTSAYVALLIPVTNSSWFVLTLSLPLSAVLQV